MALNSLQCADVRLKSCSLTPNWLGGLRNDVRFCVFFRNPKQSSFLRILELLHTFSRTLLTGKEHACSIQMRRIYPTPTINFTTVEERAKQSTTSLRVEETCKNRPMFFCCQKYGRICYRQKTFCRMQTWGEEQQDQSVHTKLISCIARNVDRTVFSNFAEISTTANT